MATTWQSSAGARDWVINLQGVEAPWPLAPSQEVFKQRHKTQKDTMGRCNNREGEAGAQGKWGHKERDVNSSGPAGDWAAGQGRPVGGGGHEGGWGRGVIDPQK